MPDITSVRTTAEAIGRITCIKTGEEIGLLYQWDNGETQAALFYDCLRETRIFLTQQTEADLGE